MSEALARHDIATVYRLLQRHGLSQRTIAAYTGQSQSEISEIIAGRKVQSYPVLTRIAHGLGIPHHLLGLTPGHKPSTPPPPPPPRAPIAQIRPDNATTKPLTISQWTGTTTRALRHAMRMSIYEFANYLGISSRMVSKWEASPNLAPRPVNQAALDTCLSRLDQAAQNRFVAQVTLAIKPQFEINFAVTCKTIEAATAIAMALSTRLAGHSHFEILDTTVGRRDLINTRQHVFCGRLLPDTTRCPKRSGHPGLCGNPDNTTTADLNQPTSEQHPPPPTTRPGQNIQGHTTQPTRPT